MTKPPPIRVLIVDDDEDYFVLARAVLAEVAEGYQVEWAGDYGDAVARMTSNQHDVYLIDYRISERDGVALMAEASSRGCTGPMVMITGVEDRGIDIRAMHAGAVGFLVKGEATFVQLERTIRYAIRQNQAVRSLQRREAQLRHAQKLEAIGRLAGGIAHDFNNMLMAILGYCDLIVTSPEDLDAETRGFVENIREVGTKAMGLTQQMLTFGRRREAEPRAISVERVVEKTSEMIRRTIRESIVVETDAASAVPAIYADPAQIQEMLVHLVVNAQDAMLAGGRIDITTQPIDLSEPVYSPQGDVPPGRYVLLTVEDTGAGIEDDKIDKIFEPFFTTKEVGEGSGLGLPMVHGVVSEAGGVVHCESRVGRGTTFRLYFPAVEDAATVSGVFPALPGVDVRGSERVLVVDDEDVVLNVVKSGLQVQGYQVLTARDAATAMALLNETLDVQVLVTDVVMPETGGVQLAAQMAARIPGLKTIFMSGYLPDKLDFDLSAPGVRFLRKPFATRTLAQTIRDLVDGENRE